MVQDGAKIGTIIGESIVDKDGIKPQLGNRPDVVTYIRTAIERLKILQIDTKVSTRDTTTDTVWGRETWNVDDWDGTYDNAPVVFVQRRFPWYTEEELNLGTASANVSTSGGELKLL